VLVAVAVVLQTVLALVEKAAEVFLEAEAEAVAGLVRVVLAEMVSM
jgi:hypothetical protein